MDIKLMLAELYAERRRIDQAIAAVEALNGEPSGAPRTALATSAQSAATKGGRRISAAGRRRIAEAAKKRWAARRKADGGVQKAAAQKGRPKRKMSEAARQRIGEAARKRWAERKKAEKKA